MSSWGRFDDLRAGTALRFPQVARELVATRPDEVPAVLAEVEAASHRGWWAFGFLSYEAAAGLGPAMPAHDPVEGLPLAWFGLAAAPERVEVQEPAEAVGYQLGEWRYDWSPAEHALAVDTVRRHIAAGETYQCNLTTRVRAQFDGDAVPLYAHLVNGQAASYNAYLDIGPFAIASASPELFFEIRSGRLSMRPMKGTAPRGRSPAEDRRILARLRASEKERAENIMIVDLIRNDMARLAVPGGVSATALCSAEQYPTVHQLTSEVTARLRPEVGLTEVFRALFPCGSVTGAPKLRTMEIIRDLEPGPRGVYCGTIGVVAPAGSPVRARFSVAIRTAVADRSAHYVTYGTGGGITWDSDPGAEYAELQAKAAILIGVRRSNSGTRGADHNRASA
ncbi:aminodeoxychorismate synthase component I [Amycolatopsis thermoflava]|uniref:aminodeoxychorismate synthase component I n=1 Tax=Amycolatopsis thermoflava TaxID=84480 RepID=UPI000687BF29|nr:aminodeoxychorismate synthase component I [Amycolatopsis thermoflava]